MKQLENQILKYISERNIAHPKDIKEDFESKKYTTNLIKSAMIELENEELIHTAQGKNYSVCLTREGKKALKMGFAKYVEMKKKEEELDHKVKLSTLFSNYINILNVLWGIAGFILGILLKSPISNLLERILELF